MIFPEVIVYFNFLGSLFQGNGNETGGKFIEMDFVSSKKRKDLCAERAIK